MGIDEIRGAGLMLGVEWPRAAFPTATAPAAFSNIASRTTC